MLMMWKNMSIVLYVICIHRNKQMVVYAYICRISVGIYKNNMGLPVMTKLAFFQYLPLRASYLNRDLRGLYLYEEPW